MFCGRQKWAELRFCGRRLTSLDKLTSKCRIQFRGHGRYQDGGLFKFKCSRMFVLFVRFGEISEFDTIILMIRKLGACIAAPQNAPVYLCQKCSVLLNVGCFMCFKNRLFFFDIKKNNCFFLDGTEFRTCTYVSLNNDMSFLMSKKKNKTSREY